MTINFETLAKEAYKEGASEEEKNALWKALFELEYWYCIAIFQEDKSYPFYINHLGKPMLLCFTDQMQPTDLALRNGLYPAQIEKPLMHIKPHEAVAYFAKFESLGFGGVCFDYDFGKFDVSFQELLEIQEKIK